MIRTNQLIWISKKIILLLSLLVLADIFIGRLLEHFYFKMTSGLQSEISYSLNNADEKLIILGSSRANHHYNPMILQDSLHLSSYNAGRDGEFILYHYCIFKNILVRKDVKVIVFDLHPQEFEINLGYDALSELLPFYNSHKEIRSMLNLRSKFEKYNAISNLYRYNSLISTIIINNVIPKKDSSLKGYLPLYSQLRDTVLDGNIPGNTNLDSLKVNLFKTLLSEAKKSRVKMFVFVSPLFQKKGITPESIIVAKHLCSEYNVPFYDFSQSAFFMTHAKCFADINHLNNLGAGIYSELVVNALKRGLNE